MKRMIVAIVLFFSTAVVASAQTTNSKNTAKHPTKHKVTKIKKAKQYKKPYTSKLLKKDTLNQRKIYHFKNGQRSTPTGREATPTNGGYSALGRDTTIKVKPKKQ